MRPWALVISSARLFPWLTFCTVYLLNTQIYTYFKIYLKISNQAWWLTPLIPEFESLRQEDCCDSKGGLGYLEKPFLKKSKHELERWLSS